MQIIKTRALLMALGLSSLSLSVQAQTLDAPQSAVGSIQDNPLGGDPEQILTTPFISLQANREWRAIVSFDVSAVGGRSVASARLKGTVGRNNALDTGTRTMNIEVFGGDCALALTDFAASAATVGSVTYDPPYDPPLSFDLEIGPELRTLLQQNPSCVKLRVRSIVNDAPNAIYNSGSDTASLTIVIDTPPDAGVPDLGPDLTVDSGPPDTAPPTPDAAPDMAPAIDASVDVAPVIDAARDDAPAAADTFVADQGAPPEVDGGVIVKLRDSGSDVAQGDSASANDLTQSSGCSCRTPAGPGAETLLSLLLAALVVLGRRRRRSFR